MRQELTQGKPMLVAMQPDQVPSTQPAVPPERPRPGAPAGVTTPVGRSGTALAARLARFRALDHRPPPPSERPTRDGGAAHAERAARLAEALDGSVEGGPLGLVVRVRASYPLAAPLAQLATLPYPVEPGHPLICLDTETTGLGTAAGTLAFLVGMGRWDGARFDVEQLLLPDHPDEPALLAAVRAAIPQDAWLVTYNGRGFDWPLLVTRFRLQGSPAPLHAGHLDLLPLARQLWRHRLPDARLATVEHGVVGVRRRDDLPGALIPGRYLEFLRTGVPELLRAVVDHNRQDLLSLGLLLAHLAQSLADPRARAADHPGDVAALARAYARRRRFPEALACCEAAIAAADSRQREHLAAERARLLRLAGRQTESVTAWREIAAAQGPLAAVAWVQLAKHLEHVQRDPAAALEAAERATALVERRRLLGGELPRFERDLARRRARLRRRLARLTRPASPPGTAAGLPPQGPPPAGTVVQTAVRGPPPRAVAAPFSSAGGELAQPAADPREVGHRGQPHPLDGERRGRRREEQCRRPVVAGRVRAEPGREQRGQKHVPGAGRVHVAPCRHGEPAADPDATVRPAPQLDAARAPGRHRERPTGPRQQPLHRVARLVHRHVFPTQHGDVGTSLERPHARREPPRRPARDEGAQEALPPQPHDRARAGHRAPLRPQFARDRREEERCSGPPGRRQRRGGQRVGGRVAELPAALRRLAVLEDRPARQRDWHYLDTRCSERRRLTRRQRDRVESDQGPHA